MICKKLLNLHQTLSLINITKLEGKCVLSNIEKYPLDIPHMVISPGLTIPEISPRYPKTSQLIGILSYGSGFHMETQWNRTALWLGFCLTRTI
jgi:hypothetical protein